MSKLYEVRTKVTWFRHDRSRDHFQRIRSQLHRKYHVTTCNLGWHNEMCKKFRSYHVIDSAVSRFPSDSQYVISNTYLGLYRQPVLSLSSHDAHVFCLMSTWYSYTVSCKNKIEDYEPEFPKNTPCNGRYYYSFKNKKILDYMCNRNWLKLFRTATTDGLINYLCWKLSFQFSQEVIHLFPAFLVDRGADWPDQREKEP